MLTFPITFNTVKAQEGSFSSGYNLLKAVKEKNYSKLRSLLQKGANTNTRQYKTGATPLYIAASMKEDDDTGLQRAIAASISMTQ